MEQRSEEVLRYLNVLLERSYKEAPSRHESFKLNREGKTNPKKSQKEGRLEKAIWEQWRRGSGADNDRFFLPWVCRFILSYQMPLWNTRADKEKSGRYADLIGVSREWLPVVIELKTAESGETPLRMLVESLAYGVAIRKAWNDPEGPFNKAWTTQLNTIAPKNECPPMLQDVPLICLAPAGYWKKCIGKPAGKRTPKQVFAEAWYPFNKLVAACAERGYPVTFAEFDVPKQDGDRLPEIHNPRAIVLPSR